jgi:phosphohistidine phosphatase SixA
MTLAVRILAGAVLLATANLATAQEAIYVVRHAERADTSEDSELSPAGVARSGRLSAILGKGGVTSIFASERRRTQQTAAPLADTLHITPTIVPAGNEEELIQKVRASRPSDRVLIVGHSNTVPSILRRLGVTDAVTIADNEFDNLFLVVPQRDGAPKFLRLKY